MMQPQSRTGHRRAALLTALLCCAAAHADSITLRGSTIPLRDVTIQQIRNGELYYRDRNDRPMQRGLDEIDSIGFENLPELDVAERALDDGERDRALTKLLQALLKADDDVQRLWLHSRLSRVHNYRSEYVPAAGHAAATMLIEPSPYWRVLEPTCEPTQSSFAAAREADDLLREAFRRVHDGTLRTVVERMRSIVHPLRRELEKQYDGPPIAEGSTWSGFPKAAIEAGELFERDSDVADTTPSDDQTSAAPLEADENEDANAPDVLTPKRDESGDADVETARSSTPGQSNAAASTSVEVDADEIDALLSDRKFREAMRLCEQAAQNIADRDVGRLLVQWGRALNGVDRPRDAAVKFTECAVLFGGTASGVEALIETAAIYQQVYRKPATSRRLLHRAIEQAELQGRASIAERARKALQLQGRSGQQ